MNIIVETDVCEAIHPKHLLLLIDAKDAEIERLQNINSDLADARASAQVRVRQLEEELRTLKETPSLRLVSG